MCWYRNRSLGGMSLLFLAVTLYLLMAHVLRQLCPLSIRLPFHFPWRSYKTMQKFPTPTIFHFKYPASFHLLKNCLTEPNNLSAFYLYRPDCHSDSLGIFTTSRISTVQSTTQAPWTVGSKPVSGSRERTKKLSRLVAKNERSFSAQKFVEVRFSWAI